MAILGGGLTTPDDEGVCFFGGIEPVLAGGGYEPLVGPIEEEDDDGLTKVPVLVGPVIGSF